MKFLVFLPFSLFAAKNLFFPEIPDGPVKKQVIKFLIYLSSELPIDASIVEKKAHLANQHLSFNSKFAKVFKAYLSSPTLERRNIFMEAIYVFIMKLGNSKQEKEIARIGWGHLVKVYKLLTASEEYPVMKLLNALHRKDLPDSVYKYAGEISEKLEIHRPLKSLVENLLYFIRYGIPLAENPNNTKLLNAAVVYLLKNEGLVKKIDSEMLPILKGEGERYLVLSNFDFTEIKKQFK